MNKDQLYLACNTFSSLCSCLHMLRDSFSAVCSILFSCSNSLILDFGKSLFSFLFSCYLPDVKMRKICYIFVSIHSVFALCILTHVQNLYFTVVEINVRGVLTKFVKIADFSIYIFIFSLTLS